MIRNSPSATHHSSSTWLKIVLALLAFYLSFATSTPALAAPPTYARNFEQIQGNGYSILKVRADSEQTHPSQIYVAAPKGAPLPQDLPQGAVIIRTPVERVVILETVHIGFLEALGKLDHIVGAGSARYIVNPSIRKGLDAGRITPIQFGQNIDVERLLLLQPDLILTSLSPDAASDISATLQRSGLPVVATAEYLENHPLGRAEWLRFIAAFFETEARAETLLQTSQTRYHALSQKARAQTSPPTVFCNAPYSGTWHIPGGASYMARFIADAGGHYLWHDNPSVGGVPLDTERVFARAARADIWLNPSHYKSLTELLQADNRFRHFKATQTKSVYNNTRQTHPSGGNAFWEGGIVHPEAILADLIKIFHPHLLPEWEFKYYQRNP